jgi:hypothetical protein
VNNGGAMSHSTSNGDVWMAGTGSGVAGIITPGGGYTQKYINDHPAHSHGLSGGVTNHAGADATASHSNMQPWAALPKMIQAVPNPGASQGMGKQAFTIGNGVATVYTVTHNLGTTDALVGARDVTTGESVNVTYKPNTTDPLNKTDVTFLSAPPTNSRRIVVMA